MLAIAPCTEFLTTQGVARLSADTSPTTRAQAAATVAVLYVEGQLNEQERQYAVSILDYLARDLERQVREALSDHLKHCSILPRSIAQTLAADVESVAVPIIRYSTVLCEADLLSIVQAGIEPKQIAVAQRDNLSAVISDALVETGNQKVVSTLLANSSARIEEFSYAKILDSFAGDDKIQALMADRPALPATIIASMVVRVSDGLRARLVERFELPDDMAKELSARAQERALEETIGSVDEDETLEVICRRLHEKGALSPVYLLRALCTGQFRRFVAGIAVLANVPPGNADDLLRDGGRRGLMALYVHAGLPGGLLPAFRIALEAALQAEADGPAPWSPAQTDRILHALVQSYDDLAPGNLESVLTQLARHCDDGQTRLGGLRAAE